MVERIDPDFLVQRVGGDPQFLQKRVTLVGCGAVGSHVAIGLAAAGAGAIRLVDPEKLEAENVHRHVLGMKHVGMAKVDGLAALIHERFPHVDVEARSIDIREDLPALTATDLAIFATGEETVERTLCRVLPKGLKRIHTWLEPLGLGGHAVAAGFPGAQACYCCLFRRDPDVGLVNMSAFVAPGQSFMRNVQGCSGTFTPFGLLDAERTAIEAVRVALDVLSGELQAPTMLSWHGSRKRFEREGGRLSVRGERAAPGALMQEEFAREDCDCCHRIAK